MSSIVSIVSAVLLVAVGCGGANLEEQKRSMKQYELAVGLQQEGNLPGAYRALYRAIEFDPINAKAHLLLGHLFLLHRDRDPERNDRRAEEHFHKVIEIQNSDAAFKENLAADARNGLGVLYIHQGRYDEAVAELEPAVSDLFNRQAYMAWGNLGWAYHEMEQYKKAVDALTRAVRLHRRFCVGYFRLGQTYVALREFEKAEKAATSAVEVDERCQRFQDAWLLRGEIRAHLGRRDDAISDFERCVELEADTEAGQACQRYLDATH